jgi:hypothetical protein
MGITYISEWVSLLANIGVLAGIVFFAFEFRHNTKQLKIQSYQSWVETNMQINAMMIDPNSSKAIALGVLDSTNLNQDNFVAFAYTMMSVMQMTQSADYLYRSGSLDTELWSAEMNRTVGILTFPGVRQWWDAGGKSQLTSGFVERVESMETNMDTWGWKEDIGFFCNNEIMITKNPN